MPFTIQKPDQLRVMRGMIFGPSGQGKTTFLGSAQLDPRTSPSLILDFEGGTESLAGLDIDIVRVTDWPTYNDVFEYLGSDAHDYQSFSVDSVSETHIFALLNILKEEGPSRKDPDSLQQGDYGKALVLLRRFVREFRDLIPKGREVPMHTFFTALSKEDLDSREGMVKKPALSGQASDEIPGLMSVVGYLALTTNEEGETIRSLLLRNHPRIRTKVRTGWAKNIPNEIDAPTVTALLDALEFPLPTKKKKEA